MADNGRRKAVTLERYRLGQPIAPQGPKAKSGDLLDLNCQNPFTASKRVFLSAQKQKYAQLDTATRQSAGEVENLAKGAKPWIFASKAEKDAYKLAQDNAAKAARRMAELDALAPKALSATDLKIANGAVTKAAEIKTDLDGLLASTKAALHPVAVKSASKP